jgi:hypothetical protein
MLLGYNDKLPQASAERASPVAAAVASRGHVQRSDSRVDAGVGVGYDWIWKVVASWTEAM